MCTPHFPLFRSSIFYPSVILLLLLWILPYLYAHLQNSPLHYWGKEVREMGEKTLEEILIASTIQAINIMWPNIMKWWITMKWWWSTMIKYQNHTERRCKPSSRGKLVKVKQLGLWNRKSLIGSIYQFLPCNTPTRMISSNPCDVHRFTKIPNILTIDFPELLLTARKYCTGWKILHSDFLISLSLLILRNNF